MNHLLNITKKELKELFTVGTVVSVVMVVAMFCFMGQAIAGETESAAAPASIGVIYEENAGDEVYSSAALGPITYQQLVEAAYKATYGNEVDLSNIHIMSAAIGDEKAIIDEMGANGYSYAVVIPKEVKTNANAVPVKSTYLPIYYIYTSGGVFGSTSSVSGELLVSGMSSVLSLYVVSDHTGSDADETIAMESPILMNSANTHTSINGTVYEGISPFDIYSAQMSQTLMIPIIVMLVITIVGSVVISSMGSEKENKTLETLLTMPVKRSIIVSGKLLAATIMGLFYGVCYLIGMMFYANGITTGMSSVSLSDYGLGMNAVDWLFLFLSLFLAIFAALGICMILGAFTKNYKMAQTMVMPITVLAIIPMLVIMFADYSSLPAVLKGFMFAIPFSHPMMAMSNLMMGNTTLVLAGIVYVAVLDAVLVYLTVRIYNSDILITGIDKTKLMRRFSISTGRKKA